VCIWRTFLAHGVTAQRFVQALSGAAFVEEGPFLSGPRLSAITRRAAVFFSVFDRRADPLRSSRPCVDAA